MPPLAGLGMLRGDGRSDVERGANPSRPSDTWRSSLIGRILSPLITPSSPETLISSPQHPHNQRFDQRSTICVASSTAPSTTLDPFPPNAQIGSSFVTEPATLPESILHKAESEFVDWNGFRDERHGDEPPRLKLT